MQRPVQLKAIIGFILFFVLFLFSITQTARAAETATLTGMEKQENPNHTRIVLRLSGLPQFTSEQSGQRVDLTLDDVQVSPGLRKLPEDERVIKILLAQKHRQLVVSLLLRQPPKQVVTETQRNPDQIVMDIYWESNDGARPSVAFRIADMPPKKAGRRAAQHQRKSQWKGRWYDFYRNYRSDWKLQLPLTYTFPPLPPLISDEQSVLWPLQQHADKKMFLSLLQTAATLTGIESDQRYLRDLLVAEAQLRTGATAAASARLHQLMIAEGSEQARVGYLTAYGEAVNGQPLVAQLQLQERVANLPNDHLFAPLNRLLLIETAVATKREKLALEQLSLQGDLWPDSLLSIVALRKADALSGTGQQDGALAIYRELIEESGLYENYPFSCGRAAFSAFKQQQYPLATDFYRKLSELLKDQPGEGLALFATGASAFEAGDLGWGMIGLQRAILDRPGTEGGDRATLRVIDLQVIKDGELGLAKGVSEYAQLGEKSNFRSVREEALFKRALGLYLLFEHQQSVVELMEFRRNFSTSSLRREVDLLLLEQLPKVVHQLLEEKDDLQAVVLVEQNRKLLLGSGFDQQFLKDLAQAFEKLGLYDRSGRVLLYLFDRSSGQPDQEELYLPLARSFLKRDEYQDASEYAGRYLKAYPQGEDSGPLFEVLLDSFDRQKSDQDLLDWLSKKDRPRSAKLEIRAAWIYWNIEQIDGVVESLEWIRNSGQELEVKEMALLGESYYQLKDNRQAEKIYLTLHDDPTYGSRAKYRSAQILLRRQNRKGALNLLKQTVEIDSEGAWGKLAQDLLIQEQR